MLTWSDPDDLAARPGVRRAYDDFAGYIIYTDDSGRFAVGYFPSPGPEAVWRTRLQTLDEAMQAAEECADHVRRLWSEM
jgi:hypothetical protein